MECPLTQPSRPDLRRLAGPHLPGRPARWQAYALSALSLLLPLGLGAQPAPAPEASEAAATPRAVHVSLENVQTTDGELLLIVADREEAFTIWEKAVVARALPMAEAAETGIALDLEPGTYAISVLHDLDGDAELDKGFLGMPKEPFGFSTNPKIRFRRPDFDECTFEVIPGEEPLLLTIRLAG